MMTWTQYDTPNIHNVSGLVSYSNSTTFNFFWPIILLLYFIIVFLTVSKMWGSRIAFAVSGWTTAIFAILLWSGGWLGDGYMLLCVLIAAISLFMLWITR